jgi:hypothetical protein
MQVMSSMTSRVPSPRPGGFGVEVRPCRARAVRFVRSRARVVRASGRGVWRAVLACLGIAVLSASGGSGSQASEYELKAALLHKFVKYVEWPTARFSDASAPIVIGVLGKDPFGEILERTFGGKKHGERPFELARLKDVEDCRRCHVLFVPQEERSQEKRLLQAVAGQSVLVVGESTGFAARGGTINFYIEDEKHLRFEINAEAAKAEGLAISSNLLKLARIVKDEREGR